MKKVTMLLIAILMISFGALVGEVETDQITIPTDCQNQTREEGNCCSCHDIGQLHSWGLNCEGNIVIWWEEGITFGD